MSCFEFLLNAGRKIEVTLHDFVYFCDFIVLCNLSTYERVINR